MTKVFIIAYYVEMDSITQTKHSTKFELNSQQKLDLKFKENSWVK